MADSASLFCSRMPITRAVGLGRLVAEELAAVVVGLLEGVERAGGEDVGGLGRAARDLRRARPGPPRSLARSTRRFWSAARLSVTSMGMP